MHFQLRIDRFNDKSIEFSFFTTDKRLKQVKVRFVSRAKVIERSTRNQYKIGERRAELALVKVTLAVNRTARNRDIAMTYRKLVS
jgi:hypothetical protein